MTVDMKKTGVHMKELFDKKNISVTEIQKELGLKSPQSVYRWYNGDAMPTVEHLYSLACMLHVPKKSCLSLNQKQFPMNVSLILYSGVQVK